MSAVDALTGSCILMRDSYIRQAIRMLSLRVIIERPISRGTPDMRQLVYIAFLSLLYMLPNTAQAHHSFAAEYDIDNYITLQGSVSEVRFRNPHVQILLDVDDNGGTTRWNVAGQSVAALRRRGIVADVISVGEAVTVSGHAGRDGYARTDVRELATVVLGAILACGPDRVVRLENLPPEIRSNAPAALQALINTSRTTSASS